MTPETWWGAGGEPHPSTVIAMIIKRSPEQYALSSDFTCVYKWLGIRENFCGESAVFVVKRMVWKALNKTQKPRNLGINQRLSRNLHIPSGILKSPFLKLKADMVIIGICNFSV